VRGWQVLFLLSELQQKLQKHDPGQHWQPVEITVESFVLAHHITARLHDRLKPLGGGEGLRAFDLGRSWHGLFFGFKKLFRRIQKLIRLSD